MSNGNLSLFADGYQQETTLWDKAISYYKSPCGKDGSKMGDTWELHGRNMGASVKLLWSYRGAICQQDSWLQEKRMSNGVLSLLFKEKNAFDA